MTVILSARMEGGVWKVLKGSNSGIVLLTNADIESQVGGGKMVEKRFCKCSRRSFLICGNLRLVVCVLGVNYLPAK